MAAIKSLALDQPARRMTCWVNDPAPLVSVVAHLGKELIRRPFVPTAELVAVLGVEPTAFGREMGEFDCAPRPGRITGPDGHVRQVRGYATADLRAAIERYRGGG